MNELKDKSDSFARKLEDIRARKQAKAEEELEALRSSTRAGAPPILPPNAPQGREKIDFGPQPGAAFSGLVKSEINLAGRAELNEIDQRFSQIFRLSEYYPANKFFFPTQYCETLEEFFEHWLKTYSLSSHTKQQLLRSLVDQESQRPRFRGVFLPGQGYFINGYWFAFGHNMTPRQALEDPDIREEEIIKTVIHEKLGHGFLNAYSTLGNIEGQLGLHLVEIAKQFGSQPAEDVASSLREEQRNLLGRISSVNEEGWATWIGGYLPASNSVESTHPVYSLERLSKAAQGLPFNSDDSVLFLKALKTLFGEDQPALPDMQKAVKIIRYFQGSALDDYFEQIFRQPLRYIVGDLIFNQMETNLGAACLPYAALIAANVTFDPATTSLTDLANRFDNDPRLHPDARLAALSRLKLKTQGDIKELAERAENELSFTVPRELKHK